MNTQNRRKSVTLGFLAGVGYFVVGVGLGELANWIGPVRGQFAVRLSAWVVSAAIFAFHIAYEHFRLRMKWMAVALHVALAAGFGAFLLAAAATVHALRVGSTAPIGLYLLALVLWPLIAGLPALVAGLVLAKILAVVWPRAA